MSAKLAQLFIKKHYWERKQANLYNQILWDILNNAVTDLFLAVGLFSAKESKFKQMDWYAWFWLTFYITLLFFYCWFLVRNIFNCYYKLPRYRQKIDELDHQIAEELKKL